MTAKKTAEIGRKRALRQLQPLLPDSADSRPCREAETAQK